MYYVVEAGFELQTILLLPPPTCWGLEGTTHLFCSAFLWFKIMVIEGST